MSKFITIDSNVDRTETFNIKSAGSCSTENTNYNRPISANSKTNYRLILITKGKFNLYSKSGEKFALSENYIALISPNVKYEYTQQAHCEDLWINFFGVDDILDKFNLNQKEIFVMKINKNIVPQLSASLNEIISELQFKEYGYEVFTKEKLLQILLYIARSINNKSLSITQPDMEKIKPAVLEMHNNYQNTLSMDEYANMCHMSKSSFMHNFAKIMHTTPIKYINSIKLTNAKFLLKESAMSINEISENLGYSSPLYFSDMFFKAFGIRPTAYRKNLNKI